MNKILLPYLSAAQASGPDAGAFLQAQLTADVSRLSDGDAGFSAYCQPSGNVLAMTRVKRIGDEFILMASRSLLPQLLSELQKYVLRARVTFAPLEEAVIGLEMEDALNYGVSSGEDAEPGAEAVVAQWRARELRSGIIWLDSATSGQYLPQMLGLETLGAISFRKGCFPGQEVIARVKYLGKLKRKPRVVEFEGALDAGPGSEVRLFDDDREVGTADLLDLVAVDGQSTAFLVARIEEGANFSVIECDGERRRLIQA
jgi:folate-binding protein YgfZ